MSMGNVLVVDDDPLTRESLIEFFAAVGVRSGEARNGREALRKLQESSFDVVLADLNMPEMSGLELLKLVREKHPQIPVILITGYGTEESATAALQAGAYDYVTRPLLDDHIKLIVEKALEQKRLKAENADLRRQVAELRSLLEEHGRESRAVE